MSSRLPLSCGASSFSCVFINSISAHIIYQLHGNIHCTLTVIYWDSERKRQRQQTHDNETATVLAGGVTSSRIQPFASEKYSNPPWCCDGRNVSARPHAPMGLNKVCFSISKQCHIEILGDVRGSNDQETEETPDKDWKATWRAVINGHQNCFLIACNGRDCIFLAVMTHTTHFRYSPLLFNSCNLL